MAGDELEDEIGGTTGDLPHPPAHLRAELLLELVWIVLESRDDLPAVASGSAPAGFCRVEHHHVRAALGQVERRRQARVAGADHRDVGAAISLEGSGCWQGLGGTPGRHGRIEGGRRMDHPSTVTRSPASGVCRRGGRSPDRASPSATRFRPPRLLSAELRRERDDATRRNISDPAILAIVCRVQLEMVERGQGRPILWLHGEDGLDPAAPVLDLLAAHGSVQAPSHPWYRPFARRGHHRHHRRSRLSLPRSSCRAERARRRRDRLVARRLDRRGDGGEVHRPPRRARPGRAARHQGRRPGDAGHPGHLRPASRGGRAAAVPAIPAAAAVDFTHAVGRSADRHRAQSRGHRALRLGAVLPQSQAAAAAAPDHRADALAVGRGRSLRQRELLRRGVSRAPSRAPGSRRSTGPGTFPISSSRRRSSSAFGGFSRRGSSPDARRRRRMGMRAWFFSENAYHLLPDAREYDSIRVKLPNRYYDPKIGADLYHRFIDEWKIAEDLGLEIMVNEHHQTATNLNPSAADRHGRPRAGDAQGPPAHPRQPHRQPARARARGRRDGDGRRLLARAARVRLRARRAVRDVGRQSSPHAHDGALLGGPRPDRESVDQPRRARSTGRASTSTIAR